MADILKYRINNGTEVEVANNSTISLAHTEASVEFTVDLDLVAVLEGETRGWFGSVGSTTSAPQQSGVYGFSVSLSQGQTQNVTITTVDAKSTLLLSQSIFSRFTDIFNITVSRAAAPSDSTTDSTGPNFLVYPDSDAALAIVNATFALTDSATTFGIVDSDYVHLRQNRDFDFLTNLPKTIDSAGIIRSLFDSDVRKSISSVDAGGDGSLTYNNATGVITYTGPSASEVRAHFGASQDLAYDASTGIFSIDVEVKYTKDNFDSDLRDRLTTTNTDSITEGSNLYFTAQRARNTINVADLGGDGSLTYDSAKGKLSYTGPLSSEVRAHFTGDKGIVYNNGSGVINIDSGNIRGMFSASGDLTYNSATGQFSFDVEQVYTKANFDSDLGDANTGQLPEGTNLYYTTARADSAFDASFALASTDSLSEGNTNLYYTTTRADSAARSAMVAVDAGGDGSFAYDSATGKFTYTGPSATEVRAHLSATDAGGDGSFSYNNSTGVLTYTGPSASEVRAHFSAQGDLTYDSATGVFQFDVEQVYTKANFDSDFNVAIDSATTSDLSEGINLYYTKARVDSDFDTSFALASTDSLSEGSTNLYYTNARADARVNLQTGANLDLSQKSTSDLSEGTNKYYTTNRVDSDFDASFALASTDSLSEGSTNLYFTNERVDDRVGALITGGVNVTATYDGAAGTLEIKVPFENIDDRVGTILTAGNGINVNYDDPNATITITNTLNTSDFTDSAFVTSRPVSTFTNDALYLDSTTAQNLINAAYIQSNQIQYNTSDFLDSTTITGVVDNTYVQARQIQYNTSNFTDSAFVTGLPISTFTNDKNYLDSTYAAALIDSAHIKAVVDSNYVQLIQADLQRDSSFISSIVTGGTLNMGANNIITTGKVLFANVYSQLSDLPSASTYHGMFAHVHATGKAYFAHAGAWVELANNSQLSNSGNWDTAFGWGNHASAGYQLAATALDSAMVYRFTIDSTRTTALVDAAYVQARQIQYNTSDFLDSTTVSGVVDNAYVQARQTSYNTSDFLDSNTVSLVVDGAYVQARQTSYNTSNFTDSAFVTGLPISTFTNDTNYLDSTTVTGVIDTAYVRARQALIDSDLTKLLVDSAYIQLRDRFQDSSLVTSTIDSAYINARVSTVDSAQVQAIIDSSYLEVIIDSDYVTARAGVVLDSASIASGVILTTVDNAYVQSRQIQYNTSDFLDSTTVSLVVDGAYVQARQQKYNTSDFTDSAFVTGLPVSTFTNDVQYLDSTTVQGVISASYIQSNQNDYLDSTLTSQLIDSAYIALRTTTGTDSSTVINLIDSDYISNRVVAFANPIFTEFKYITDSAGQIVFEGNDANGNALSIETGNHSVFVNGIRLLPSDFTSDTTNNRITLDSTGAAADEIVISTIKGKNALAGIAIIDSDYISSRTIAVANPQFNNFRYIATSNQTAFTGADVNSKALNITPSNFQVFLNGVRLLDSDFTADTDNNTITLSSGATASDELVVTTVIGQTAVAGIAAVDSAYIQARVAAGTDSSTVISLVNDTVDSAYINARVSTVDSAQVLGIVDSGYVQARQEGVNATFKDYKFVATANQTVFSGTDANGTALSFEANKFHVLLNGIRLDASDFTESAANNKITLATGAAVSDELIVSTIGTEKTTTLTSITSTVDSAYVQARQVDLQRDSAFVTGIIDSAYIEPLLTPIHISGSNVGIGTGSSGHALTISANEYDGIQFQKDGADNGYIGIGTSNLFVGAVGNLIFHTGNASLTNGSERMRIDGNGRVLIGTTTLSAYSNRMLTVSGNNDATIEIRAASTSGHSQLVFSDGSAADNTSQRGYIIYDHADETFKFGAYDNQFMHASTFGSTDGYSAGRLAVGYNNNAASSNNRQFALHVGGHRYYHPAMMVEDYDPHTQYASDLIRFHRNGNNGGEITSTGSTSISYYTSSDYRLKNNIQDLDSAINIVKALKPRKFTFKAEDSDGLNRYFSGFIAHEVDSAVPLSLGIVGGTKDQVDSDNNPITQSVDYGKMTPLLVKGLQEALEKIETLEAKVAALEGGG